MSCNILAVQYGVQLIYSDDGKQVVAQSVIPDLSVRRECLHYDKHEPAQASPVSNEFTEYWLAMETTLTKITESIESLQAEREALTKHLESSMMIGSISKDEVIHVEKSRG